MSSKDTEFAAITGKLLRCLVRGGAKVKWGGRQNIFDKTRSRC